MNQNATDSGSPRDSICSKTALAGLRPRFGEPAVSAAGFPAMPPSGSDTAPSAASLRVRRRARPEAVTPILDLSNAALVHAEERRDIVVAITPSIIPRISAAPVPSVRAHSARLVYPFFVSYLGCQAPDLRPDAVNMAVKIWQNQGKV